MRLLKPVLTALIAVLAIVAGLIASMVIALTGAILLMAHRLLRLRKASATTSHSATRTTIPRTAPDEPIDVVATEVPSREI